MRWWPTSGSRTQETSTTCTAGRSSPPCQSWWITTQRRTASCRTRTVPSSSSNTPWTPPTPPQRGVWALTSTFRQCGPHSLHLHSQLQSVMVWLGGSVTDGQLWCLFTRGNKCHCRFNIPCFYIFLWSRGIFVRIWVSKNKQTPTLQTTRQTAADTSFLHELLCSSCWVTCYQGRLNHMFSTSTLNFTELLLDFSRYLYSMTVLLSFTTDGNIFVIQDFSCDQQFCSLFRLSVGWLPLTYLDQWIQQFEQQRLPLTSWFIAWPTWIEIRWLNLVAFLDIPNCIGQTGSNYDNYDDDMISDESLSRRLSHLWTRFSFL